MKIHGANRRHIFSLGILAASFAIALAVAPKPKAQTRETQSAPTHKFTVTDGDSKTYMAVTMKNLQISSVTGTRNRNTFNFKPIRAGEKPKITGRPNQVLKCVGLKHDGGDYHWTFCFYVDNSDGSAADKPGSDYIEILSFSLGGDMGGGGGGGSTCWEDEDLQMSICDP
jgi:hypothetical protein